MLKRKKLHCIVLKFNLAYILIGIDQIVTNKINRLNNKYNKHLNSKIKQLKQKKYNKNNKIYKQITMNQGMK